MLERRHRKQERRLGNEKWRITPGLNEKGVTRRGAERGGPWREGQRESASRQVELKDYHYSVNASDID